MLQDIKKVIDIIESLKLTPSYINIYYSLDGCAWFDVLDNNKKEEVIERIY